MQTSPSFAYSLCQVEEGWRWSVYDEDGVTVARGADASRDGAHACDGKMPKVAMQYCTVRVGMQFSCGWLPPARLVDWADIGNAVASVMSDA